MESSVVVVDNGRAMDAYTDRIATNTCRIITIHSRKLIEFLNHAKFSQLYLSGEGGNTEGA